MAEDGEESAVRRGGAAANGFGIVEAFVGFCFGEIIGALAIAATDSLTGQRGANFGATVAGLLGLWCGLVGGALAASYARRRGVFSLRERLSRDYGLSFRPSDVPLGIAVGLASSFVLVPLLELPLVPFVPDLTHRLGDPARQLTEHINGGGYALLALLVCVGTPVVEELFFRGLLLRGLLGRFRRLGDAGAIAASSVLCGIFFGLAHFQAIEVLALSGFGVVLSLLALRIGRLGPGIFAHATFNAITIIALARTH